MHSKPFLTFKGALAALSTVPVAFATSLDPHTTNHYNNPVTQSSPPLPKTFGKGVPNFPVVATEEREVFAYNISANADRAALTHFWSTACGGDTPPFDGPLAGATIYRFYFDGETEASIEMQPRMVSASGVARHAWP